MPKRPTDKEVEDRLLEYFKSVPNKKLIINLYLSYMAAVEFIMHMELDQEYIEFSNMQRKKHEQKKQSSPIESFLSHLQTNTDWNDTEN